MNIPNDHETLILNDEASGASLTNPVVSIILPHFNDLENLGLCLSLLRAQTFNQSQFEIIVADNNSQCGLTAVKRVCEGTARVVSAPIQGASEARNAGVLAARGQILGFIDSDCRPAPEWIERGVRALSDADVVGGRVKVSVDNPNRLTAAEAYELAFAFNNRRYVEQHGYSTTANMFVAREVFTKVGLFRAVVSEDVDWGKRATALGLRLRYVGDAVVSHPARREWSDLIGKWRRMTRESYALALEHPWGKLRWFARSWLILLSPLVHFLVVLRCDELPTLDGRLRAIGALIRLRTWRFIECNRKLLNF